MFFSNDNELALHAALYFTGYRPTNDLIKRKRSKAKKKPKKNLTNGKHLTVCSVNDLAVKRGETKRPSAEFTIRSAPPTLAAYAQRRQSRNTALNHDRFRSRGGVF